MSFLLKVCFVVISVIKLVKSQDHSSNQNSFINLTTSNNRVIVNKNRVNSVEISVRFEAYQRPKFQWFDNVNREINKSYVYNVEVSDNEVKLKITDVGYEHFGNFTLQAKNDVIEQSITIELIIEGKPETFIFFKINPAENEFDLFKNIHENFIQNLRSLSLQYPKVTWHVNVKEDDNLSFFLVSISSPKATQNISITNYLEVLGNTCNISTEEVSADVEDVFTRNFFQFTRINFHPKSNQTLISVYSENVHGSNVATKAVTFGERTLVIQFKDNRPQTHPSNEVTEGDEVRIECQIGFTQCGKDIYWFFNNKLIEETHPSIEIKNANTKFSRRKTITFKNVTKADEGLYECLLAKAESRRENLKLMINPDFDTFPDQVSSQYIKVFEKTLPVIYSNFENNESISLPNGSEFDLICKVSSNPQSNLKWFKDGDEIVKSSEANSSIVFKNSKLFFTKLNPENTGNYSCLATNEVGNDEKFVSIKSSESVKLDNELTKILELSTPFKILIVNKETSKTAWMKVNFKALIAPNFTWFDNNGKIVYTNKTVLDLYKYNVREDVGSITLDFQFVDYHCFGNFTLMAEIWGLSENITIELIVRGKPILYIERHSIGTPYFPKLDQILTDGEFFKAFDEVFYSDAEMIKFLKPTEPIQWIGTDSKNEDFTMRFYAFGFPRPEIAIQMIACGDIFFSNCLCNAANIPLLSRPSSNIDSHKFLRAVEITFQPDFNISAVDFNATNVYGETKTWLRLNMGEKIPQIKLQTKIPTKSSEAMIGDDVQISCHVSYAQCDSQMFWTFNETILREFDRFMFVRDTSTPDFYRETLMIQNVTKMHEGIFNCVLISEKDREIFFKTGMSKNIRQRGLHVHQHLKVFPSQPAEMVLKFPEKIEKTIGERLKLQCHAEGYPQPTLQWFKDGEILEITHNVSKRIFWTRKNISMMFTSLEIGDSGNYSCLAKNFNGFNATNSVIEVSDPIPYTTIVLGLVSIFIITVISIFFLIKYQKDRKKIQEMKETGLANFEEGDIYRIDPNLDINEQASFLPYDKRFEFPKEKLKLEQRLGAGAFGVVLKGVATDIYSYENKTIVAVKTVEKQAENQMFKALIAELKIMVHIGKHLNIVNLLGAVTKNIAKRELFVIVEFCEFGNLQDFLQCHRSNFVNQIFNEDENEVAFSKGVQYSYVVPVASMGYVTLPDVGTSQTSSISLKTIAKGSDIVLNTSNLISWAFQIARGMEYLTSKKILHGDLAARNVLLCEDHVVKICDFGLAKSLYKQSIYMHRKETPLPFRWLALESITDRIFSVYSDVWSYGVLLWEIFTLGQLPYGDVENLRDLRDKLLNGERLEKPEYATQSIYDIMLSCWVEERKERPLFQEFSRLFGDMLHETVKEHYLTLNNPYTEENSKNLELAGTNLLTLVTQSNVDSIEEEIEMNEMK